jgi:hypothetical protein
VSAKRVAARRARRVLWSWRRELVHAAGCAYTKCATAEAYRSVNAYAWWFVPTVRVPRSLRHFAALSGCHA